MSLGVGPLPDVELELRATPANVGVARQAIRAAVGALGWAEDRMGDVSLAVSEACSNVVVHAYCETAPAAPRPLGVRLFASPEAILVSVWDNGPGMVPRANSPGLGVGLPLMSALSDSVELSTGANGGSDVRLSFTREARNPVARERAADQAGRP